MWRRENNTFNIDLVSASIKQGSDDLHVHDLVPAECKSAEIHDKSHFQYHRYNHKYNHRMLNKVKKQK